MNEDEHTSGWAEFRAKLPQRLAALTLPEGPVQREDVAVLGDSRLTPDQLLAVLREQVKLQQVAGPLHLTRGVPGGGHMAAAWREVVYKQVRAVLALFEAGLPIQAQPNARSALEHAVLLQVFAEAHALDDVDTFLHSVDVAHGANAKRATDRLKRQDQRMGSLFQPEVEAASEWLSQLAAQRKRERPARAEGAEGPRLDLGQSRALFDALPGGGEHFHNIYGDLSEGAHAGLASALPYYRGRELAALRNLLVVRWADALATLSWACWAADDAVDEFVTSPQLAVRHEAVTEPFGFLPGESRRKSS